jgi:hypothetical protein
MNKPRELWTALAVTLIVRVVTVTLLLTVFWSAPAVSHLVQDIRTWREFFAETQAGAIPYVNLTKEYPVLGGILYWLMSPFIRPDDLRQTIAVHAAFMTVADLVNTVLFYRLAREIAPRWAFAATLALNLNLTAVVTAPVRYESWIVTFVLLGYLAHRRAATGRRPRSGPSGAASSGTPRSSSRPRNGGSWWWSDAGGTGSARASYSPAVTAALNLPVRAPVPARDGIAANWLAPYIFHVKRPLYWDTLLGVGQIWLGPLPWERYAGLWSLALMLVAVVVRPRMPIEYKASSSAWPPSSSTGSTPRSSTSGSIRS